MPTSATHITIIQRVAADRAGKYDQLLGDPDPELDEDDPRAIKMRFAQLGACGPDIFYAMADYGSDLQDCENFLLQIGATFDCIGGTLGDIDRWVHGAISNLTLGVADSLEETCGLVSAVINDAILGLIVKAGFNFWPWPEARRQLDLPRTSWFWADYLHYVRTGTFALNLVQASHNQPNRPNLRAYAYGYLSHYVTDVVGHPYVNQVVRAPWRLYWQRHHLVENFIDAYVWDRWHTSSPPPDQPTTEEQKLDRLVSTPNDLGSGAPLTFARLNDHVNIGRPSTEPLDPMVAAVCAQIQAGSYSVGIAQQLSPPNPDQPDFTAWAQMVADAVKKTYQNDSHHPRNLANSFLNRFGVAVSRPDGLPTKDDVAATYGVWRLLLRVTTEHNVEEPVPPDVVADLTDILHDFQQKVDAILASVGPPPAFKPTSLSWPGLKHLLRSLVDALVWAIDVLNAVVQVAFQIIKSMLLATVTLVADGIKYLLYLVSKALYGVYRHLHDVLVLNAYSVPFTDQLDVIYGARGSGAGFDFATLWRSPGNPAANGYPIEEDAKRERKYVNSDYSPAEVPSWSRIERPSVRQVAPYTPSGRDPLLTPDAFIDGPRGPDDMFDPNGPTFTSKRNFGGAIENTKRAIDLAYRGFPSRPTPTGRVKQTLPNYNLDGDRGYAWPCWVVKPEPTHGIPTDGNALNPLDPKNQPGGVATVKAQAAP